ncbi:XrtA/PEP-CTERM system histidine kinase PrsK [Saccharophagus degradans]|uniref:histidine kinase n=1 Tax=Saccharophagus degradans TaxID=86304 RepID=A0AAW7X9H9_9GAMM|nr:XrtA/PEP-CTERM system histidine kinase PrsK [Saccharophagus degradans]MDO6423102.1 PEP-CTERM system histidine kinase PrsK [Saccharophagus degradans]MDO6607374.1 PEP-CTERM system histidine kinase PrsK [Saccharophagus degradans]
MEFSSVTQTAFLCACVLSFAFTATCVYQAVKSKLHIAFIIAAIVQTGWLAILASAGKVGTLSVNTLLVAEAAHYISWIFALTFATLRYTQSSLPRVYTVFIWGVSIATFSASAFALTSNFDPAIIAGVVIWQGILLSVVGLLSVEQLYRNVSDYRLIKLICLNLAIIFIFDAYLFAQHLVLGHPDADLWQARAAVSIATSVFMAIGVMTLNQPRMQSAKLTFSRPVVFYSTSLTLAGALLTILAIGGYYVRLYGGDWGTVIYTVLMVCGLGSLLFVFASKHARENLNVLINKHLFTHKYDYRSEWLRLIDQLSQPTSIAETHARAIIVLADLFKCSGGALWLKRGKVMVPTRQVNIHIADVSETFEPNTSPFCATLEQEEWVFCLRSNDKGITLHNEHLPYWIDLIDDIWLVLPLLNENILIGFVVLTSPKSESVLNWEDLDLIKTVGRQVASYIVRHEQSELLTEARQFDAFNKLSAFVMHDLKNLIAQQSLVVSNAEKHKDNPAFVEDVINTINNSVTRMNNLLRKLQHSEPEQAKTLAIKDALVDAIKRCQKYKPAPTLMSIDPNWRIKADPDSLNMVFTHIIQNAQDATSSDGYVDISASQEDQLVRICIEDNGEGMDEDFIQNRLFKPFETTKTGKGMGIGVFQAREYIQSLGGNIVVESTLGEGTTFIITLPIL